VAPSRGNRDCEEHSAGIRGSAASTSTSPRYGKEKKGNKGIKLDMCKTRSKSEARQGGSNGGPKEIRE